MISVIERTTNLCLILSLSYHLVAFWEETCMENCSEIFQILMFVIHILVKMPGHRKMCFYQCAESQWVNWIYKSTLLNSLRFNDHLIAIICFKSSWDIFSLTIVILFSIWSNSVSGLVARRVSYSSVSPRPWELPLCRDWKQDWSGKPSCVIQTVCTTRNLGSENNNPSLLYHSRFCFLFLQWTTMVYEQKWHSLFRNVSQRID